MAIYAIRDPENGKYMKKGSRYTDGRYDEPQHFYTNIGHAKSAITSKWDDKEFEIIRFETTYVGVDTRYE